jgi:hypothetical protein
MSIWIQSLVAITEAFSILVSTQSQDIGRTWFFSRYKADVFPEGSAIMKLTGNVVLKSAPLLFMLQSSEKNLTHASYVSSKSAVWTSDVLLSPLRLQRISTKTITTSRMGRNFLSKLKHVACLI